MTRTPIDRGFAFITRRDDGTSDVVVATSLKSDNSPDQIVSSHHSQQVEFGRSVRTVRAGKDTLRTLEPALVRGDSEQEKVWVRADR